MSRHIIAASTLLLAACGSSGPQAPDQFSGTWGADCSSPFVRFSGNTIHIFPDNADYNLTSISVAGNALSVGYDSTGGAALETYVLEGDQLRLDRGTYGGSQASWHKAPMKKCS